MTLTAEDFECDCWKSEIGHKQQREKEMKELVFMTHQAWEQLGAQLTALCSKAQVRATGLLLASLLGSTALKMIGDDPKDGEVIAAVDNMLPFVIEICKEHVKLGSTTLKAMMERMKERVEVVVDDFPTEPQK